MIVWVVDSPQLNTQGVNTQDGDNQFSRNSPQAQTHHNIKHTAIQNRVVKGRPKAGTTATSCASGWWSIIFAIDGAVTVQWVEQGKGDDSRLLEEALSSTDPGTMKKRILFVTMGGFAPVGKALWGALARRVPQVDKGNRGKGKGKG